MASISASVALIAACEASSVPVLPTSTYFKRQSRPDSGLGFQADTFQVVPASSVLRLSSLEMSDTRTLWALNTGPPARVVIRCRVNMAHKRQLRPDFGLGIQIEVINTFKSHKGPSCSLLARKLTLRTTCSKACRRWLPRAPRARPRALPSFPPAPGVGLRV